MMANAPIDNAHRFARNCNGGFVDDDGGPTGGGQSSTGGPLVTGGRFPARLPGATNGGP